MVAPEQERGADRRFKNNRQLPICLYDVMHLSSSSGVNELMEFSRIGFVRQFSAALDDLPRRQAKEGWREMLRLESVTTTDQVDVPVSEPTAPRWRKRLQFLLLGTAILTGGIAIMAGYALHHMGSPISAEVSRSVILVASGLSATSARTSEPIANAIAPEPITKPAQVPASKVPMVTVKTTANIRDAPTASSKVVRVADAGEKLVVFGRSNGWAHVGTDRPIGWIAIALTTE